MSNQASTPKKGSGGLIFTAIYLAAMVLLFIGERLVLESTGLRAALGSVAGAGILAVIVGRLLRRRQAPERARSVEGLLALCYLVGLISLLLYLAQADFVMDRLRPLFSEAQGANRYAGTLAALWPVVWLCSILPLLFMEISYASMDLERTMEPGRVRRSARSGLVLALTLCIVFVLNYMVSEFNKKADLSYFKTTRPSESSQKMVQNLSEPFKAVLFFPGANEVQEQVEAYFAELKQASKHFSLQVKDHAMEPTLAKDLSVSNNGAVVLVRGKQNEKIQVGTELKQAKRTLKKLDSEFQRAFTKLSRAQRVAYFTVGHEERTEQNRDKIKDSSIRAVRSLLRRLNYETKDLGIAQGLGSGVPGDATVVILAGPRKAFLAAEVAALKKYLRGGGRMMAFLDPEAGLDYSELLGPFGLRFSPVRLANDRSFVRVTYTTADRHFLFSNRFSTHPSVSTLTRNSSRLAAIMLGVGSLEEIPPTEGGKPQVQFTIHSMPSTWNDVNSNRIFEAGTERRKEYEVAAVVTMTLDKKDKAKDKEMRMVVMADSNFISDQIFRNAGNGYAFLDALKWLGGEEETMGETTSEEDIRMVHTRDKDQLWFYLTIFGVPAVVLAGGLIYTRRRRRS